MPLTVPCSLHGRELSERANGGANVGNVSEAGLHLVGTATYLRSFGETVTAQLGPETLAHFRLVQPF